MFGKQQVSAQERVWSQFKLTAQKVLENEDLANRAPDSTRAGRERPWTWKPPLVSHEEEAVERPKTWRI